MHPNRADRAHQPDSAGASIVGVNGLMVVGGVGLVTNLSDATINNTNAFTLFPATAIIPADSLQVGTLIEVEASGVSNTDINTLIDFAWPLGGGYLALGLNTQTDNALLHWGIKGSAIMRSLGSGGTFMPGHCLTYREKSGSPSSTVISGPQAAALTSLDTTVDNLVQLGVHIATANVLRTVTLQTFAVRVTNPASTTP